MHIQRGHETVNRDVARGRQECTHMLGVLGGDTSVRNAACFLLSCILLRLVVLYDLAVSLRREDAVVTAQLRWR